MKRVLGVLAVFVLSSSAPAAAYDIVQNGGFETPPLSSWQTFNQGSSGGQGSWYSHTSGNGTYSGLPTSPPAVGSWQAVGDNSGRAAAILYQDLAIPATSRATLSFVLWHGNAAPGGGYVNGANLSPGNTNQRVRVDVISTGTNLLTTSSGVLALAYQTSASTPVVVNPTTITTDLTALAGQTVRLRIALVATNGGLIAGIDQVKLEVSPFSILAPALPWLLYPSICWGDFNGDGRLELALTGETAGTRVGWIERWNTGGFWDQPTVLPPGFAVAPADLDGDGDLDLGVSGAIPGLQLAAMINDGFGGFSIAYHPTGSASGILRWGDYDRDGDLDALENGELQDGYYHTFIARNDGPAGFTVVDPGLVAPVFGDVEWTDVNNDGALDIAMTGGVSTIFYFGTGYGDFTSVSSGLPQISSGRIAAGDLDNDGIEELVVTGGPMTVPPGLTRVYKYDGAGAWNEMPAGLTQVYGSDVSLGDFDHDGWLDIASLGTTGGQYKFQLYHNNGNGTLTDIGANLPGTAYGPMDFGDFDGDGDLDLVAFGSDGFTALSNVFLNSTPTPNAAPTPPGLLFSQLAEADLLLRFGSFGNDDHTPPAVLTRNFRAGTSPGTCDLMPPMSDLATGRRLVARPGESRLASWKRLALNRIGHRYAVYWSVQNVDQSYVGSGWAPEQTVVLGPTILGVADVPNDQGGHVRLTVQQSVFDDAARMTYAAMGYNVWRLVPGTVASTVARDGVALDPAAANARLAARTPDGERTARIPASLPESGLSLIEWNGRLFTRDAEQYVGSPFPAGTWEIVASWFANQQSSYVVASTTLADSGVAGVNDQTYLVTMHTTTPSVWFASLPVSGHSVDNLAPAPPVGLVAHHHTGSGNQLVWQPAPETDFESFRIYRGTTSGFVAGPATLVASAPAPAWTDPVYDLPIVFYKVSTTDHAGNESPAVAPGATTAVGDDSSPLAFSLREASPNPFGSETRIGLALPAASSVRLEVFDASGRRVRTLLDGWMPAGEHEVSWRGDDQAGRPVRAGLYFCRLEAGAQRATRRLARMP